MQSSILSKAEEKGKEELFISFNQYHIYTKISFFHPHSRLVTKKYGGLCQSLCILMATQGLDSPSIQALIKVTKNQTVDPVQYKNATRQLNLISKQMIKYGGNFFTHISQYDCSLLSVEDRIKFLHDDEFKSIDPDLVKTALSRIGKDKYLQICLVEDFKREAAHIVLLKQKNEFYEYYDPNIGICIDKSFENIMKCINYTVSKRSRGYVIAIDFIDIEKLIQRYIKTEELFLLDTTDKMLDTCDIWMQIGCKISATFNDRTNKVVNEMKIKEDSVSDLLKQSTITKVLPNDVNEGMALPLAVALYSSSSPNSYGWNTMNYLLLPVLDVTAKILGNTTYATGFAAKAGICFWEKIRCSITSTKTHNDAKLLRNQ